MGNRVWIVQCLCPMRHCILAASGEARDAAAASPLVDELKKAVGELISSRTFNPWCGICHSPMGTWKYELARTRFGSMAEAAPFLRQNEEAQAVTRAILGDIPRND